jgi:uncharacterized protein YqkB
LALKVIDFLLDADLSFDQKPLVETEPLAADASSIPRLYVIAADELGSYGL